LAHLNAWIDNHPNKCGCSLDPETLVAQWMMESNWGRSSLVQSTWNFGNVKGQGPAGSTKANVPEHIGGKNVVVGANFRKYHGPEEFYEDYYKVLCGNDRYKNARGKMGREYFQALKDAGYATDPDYVDKAMQIYKQLGFQ
jgi:flagellum-specific peptidoglycan hydrolase FlgJ